MAGVSEQVSKEVNKSLAERGYPTMKPEHDQLLKGQIRAVVEPDNAVYKLMSKNSHFSTLIVIIYFQGRGLIVPHCKTLVLRCL